MDRRKIFGVVAVSIMMSSQGAFADGASGCKGQDCKPGREVSFNVFCHYQREQGQGQQSGYEKCQTGATFRKWVAADGGEVEDRSDSSDNPEFEVECDGQRIFNNSAHRYTDGMGTRLQAEAGPYPAVLLPRDSLSDGHRYVESALELDEQRLRGFCYVYTGPQ